MRDSDFIVDLTNVDLTNADSIRAYIDRHIVDALMADPVVVREIWRDPAQILYGTAAIKQPPSRHTISRRAKRRAKRRGK